MINCPKCGFSQPQDHYCASCGVNMDTYRPAQKSVSEIFFSNPKLQAAVLIMLLLSAFTVFKFRSASRHFAQLKERTQQESYAVDAASEDGAADFSKREKIAAPPRVMAESTTPPSPPAAVMNPQAPQGAGATGQPPQARAGFVDPNKPVAATSAAGGAAGAVNDQPKAASKVRIFFVQIQRQALGEIVAEARGVDSLKEISSGVLPGADAKLKSLKPAWNVLEEPTLHDISKNTVISVNHEIHDDQLNQDLGLSLSVTPTAADETQTQIVVRTNRTLREPQNAAGYLKEPFAQQFAIPRGGAAFISGTLLHRPLADAEKIMYAGIDVVRVMTTPEYASQATEFVIFVEPR
jgi:hypothetical protein